MYIQDCSKSEVEIDILDNTLISDLVRLYSKYYRVHI